MGFLVSRVQLELLLLILVKVERWLSLQSRSSILVLNPFLRRHICWWIVRARWCQLKHYLSHDNADVQEASVSKARTIRGWMSGDGREQWLTLNRLRGWHLFKVLAEYVVTQSKSWWRRKLLWSDVGKRGRTLKCGCLEELSGWIVWKSHKEYKSQDDSQRSSLIEYCTRMSVNISNTTDIHAPACMLWETPQQT